MKQYSTDIGYCTFNYNRHRKNDEPIKNIGDIDELQSHIGFLISLMKEENDLYDFDRYFKQLIKVQRNLYNILSYISSGIEINENIICEIETDISEYHDSIPYINSFALPGEYNDNKISTYCNVCRTVTRRIERRLVEFYTNDLNIKQHEIILIYIDRLSDYFFVLAEYTKINI